MKFVFPSFQLFSAERKGFEPSKRFHVYTLSSSVNESSNPLTPLNFYNLKQYTITNNSQTYFTNFQDFKAVVSLTPQPIILLEGTRKLSKVSDAVNIAKVGKLLSEQFPTAIFRTGNATGTDFYFSEGIEKYPNRILQKVIPYTGHRVKHAKPSQNTFSLSSISADELHYLTEVSSNANKLLRRLFDYNFQNPSLTNKSTIRAKYLLRDTVKVIGSRGLGLAPATFALLYVNENAPFVGGTGHTLQVCLKRQTPVITQQDFFKWI